MSKYHAKATTVDGIRFASQKEARRYGELKLLEKAGEIYALSWQFRYDLHVRQQSVGANLQRAAAKLMGKPDPIPTKKVGSYVADFVYRRASDDAQVVEDVKGFKTPLYKWKKRHVEAQYGITILET